MAKQAATAIELEWMGRVKRLRCVLCELLDQQQDSITDAHHARTGQGAAERGPAFCTIALCHDSCHQGPKGIHGDKSRLRIAKVDEMDLLAMTTQRVYQQIKHEAR